MHAPTSINNDELEVRSLAEENSQLEQRISEPYYADDLNQWEVVSIAGYQTFNFEKRKQIRDTLIQRNEKLKAKLAQINEVLISNVPENRKDKMRDDLKLTNPADLACQPQDKVVEI